MKESKISITSSVNDYPFFRLSEKQDIILYLLKREIQSAKFQKELERVFDTPVFSFDLLDLIMSLIGFRNKNDELWGWYLDRLHEHAAKIDLQNNQSTSEVTMEFFLELMNKVKQEQ